MSFTPSSYQLAIRDELVSGTSNLIIDAKAGAAKSSTILYVIPFLPLGTGIIKKQVIVLAFNKAIADSMQARLPAGAFARTFHSLGLAALRSILPKGAKIGETRKVSKLVWNAVGRECPDTQAIIKLVGLAKNVGIGVLLPDEDSSWHGTMRHYEIEFEEPAASLRVARKVLIDSSNDLSVIDFDDMLYLPLLYNCPFPPQDYLFVDEAQDTNSVREEIIARSCKNLGGNMTTQQTTPAATERSNPLGVPPTRIIAVGDPHQAIYGFSGANADSMDRIKKRFNCKTMPLDVSYRISRAVCKAAQHFVPSIQHSDFVLEGKVERLADYTPDIYVPGSAVLCRNVAPLVSHAYSLLQRDIPCVILGRDIGTQLVNLVKKLRAANLEDFRQKLVVWQDREVRICETENRSPEPIYDKTDCLRFFCDSLDEDSQGIPDLIAKIELMFTDDQKNISSRVTLSSVHKSKGLEYHTVFILDRDTLMPSKFAKLPWQITQEKNLIYVAITRSSDKLYYINSSSWKQEQTT